MRGAFFIDKRQCLSNLRINQHFPFYGIFVLKKWLISTWIVKLVQRLKGPTRINRITTQARERNDFNMVSGLGGLRHFTKILSI